MLITFLIFIRLLAGSFQGFSFWCFHNAIFIPNSWWKRYLTVGINFISNHILDFLQNTTKTDYYLSILNDIYWKNFKTWCVKFIGKIGHTLVGDLAYIIMHHLNQFVEPCHCKIKNFQKLWFYYILYWRFRNISILLLIKVRETIKKNFNIVFQRA